MNMRRTVLLFFLFLVFATYAQTNHEGISDIELRQVVGGWSYFSKNYGMVTKAYSWGEDNYLLNMTIEFDIANDSLLITVPGFGDFVVERIDRLSENKYRLLILRSNMMDSDIWPLKGFVIITFVDKDTMEVDDSGFSIFGFNSIPGKLYRIAGPKIEVE